MLKSSPLLEKRVLVPRGEREAKSFSHLVEKYGGIPVEIPLIAFCPIEPNQQLQSVLKELHTYDWIIFTSKITVETFLSFIDKDTKKPFPKVAVIGKKTAEILVQKGFTPEFIPSSFVAESFAEEFTSYVKSGLKVLIPKGNLAREHIASVLTKEGAYVDEVVIYETFMPEASSAKIVAMMTKKQLDILMFTSPSTVDHFMSVIRENNLEDQLKDCIISCIGPVTEKKLTSFGLKVHASPQEFTVEEMVKSTIAYLEKDV